MSSRTPKLMLIDIQGETVDSVPPVGAQQIFGLRFLAGVKVIFRCLVLNSRRYLYFK